MTPVDPSNQPSPATQRPNTAPQRPQRDQPRGGGGDRGGDGGRRRGGNDRPNDPNSPSPWLDPENPPPTPHNEASFVEYLRWMRSPDCADSITNDKYKKQLLNNTKLDLLSQAASAQFDRYLTRRDKQIKQLTKNGECFTVSCSWRVRVGGHRGPESILLPAFDAQGVPYIPSSTLRGVARSQAIRDVGEDKAAKVFGALDTKDKADRAGKIIFFDAYPQPGKLGLSIDMANNIWKWEGDDLKYAPNPNPFFSLHKPTLTIGLRSASHSSDTDLAQVKKWLIAGLQAGIGSQVNSGYGEMLRPGQPAPTTKEFLRVKFELEGQLIHGRQDFTEWEWKPPKGHETEGKWRMYGDPQPELRPIAFKSMLRYWFRVFALSRFDHKTVQILEGKLFGTIQAPVQWGWVKFNIYPSQQIDEEQEIQKGELSLSFSQSQESHNLDSIEQFFKSLIWIAFHLGGVGQGARRPLYKRNRKPLKRGTKLVSSEEWLERPQSPKLFGARIQKEIRSLYQNLNQLSADLNLNPSSPDIHPPSDHSWQEIADKHCRLVITQGESSNNKPFALDVLHDYWHQLKDEKRKTDAKSLCGSHEKDFFFKGGFKVHRDALPSPIWVASFNGYQVVCIFGITNSSDNPRQNYFKVLKKESDTFSEIDFTQIR